MFSVTSLELLNRVRLFRRQPETTVIATPEDQVTLNAINMAIEDVLSTRRWEFDLRSDGQLALRGKKDGLLLGTTAGSTSGTLTIIGVVGADVFGDYVVKVQPDGITDYANTALRVESAITSGGNAAFLVFEFPFPDTNSPAVDCELHYGEYILPDTVREVVRASYQEDPISLDQVDPTVRYSEIFPRPHDYFGPPEALAVGGFDVPTYNAHLDAPDPGLRMAVWPVPDEDYIVNYSYYYRHPELVASTDTLVGVPNAVVNDIVLQAASTVMMTWDQNYAASHFTDLSRQQSAAKHRATGGSPGRRHTIRSFERGGSTVSLERGFPNKVIG